MLLARALVFGVSLRGLLAVGAMALAVAYALIAVGAMAGLQTSSQTVEEAQAEPGWVVFDPAGGGLDPASLPSEWTVVSEASWNGTRLATVEPWPYESDRLWLGGHLSREEAARVQRADLNMSRAPADYAPPDAATLPPERFWSRVSADEAEATTAFVSGADPPVLPAGLGSAPWVGVGVFYAEGAAEVISSLVLLVLASALIVALLSSGFLHLEVLARQADLSTVAALAGRRVVRRLVFWRTLVLVGASVLLGVTATLVVFRIGNAAGVGPLVLDPVLAVLLVLPTAVAGVLAGFIAGMRALSRGESSAGTQGAGGVRRFPGPVRFLVVTPRVSPGILAAVLLTGLVLSGVLHTAAVPAQIFGTRGDEIVLVEAQANPLRGHADRFLGENAHHLEGVRAAWPETFAPTTWQGEPLLVKGVSFASWSEGVGARLSEGRWPAAEGEATVGARAADRLEIGVGDSLQLPRSYHRGVERLTVVGVHQTGGLEDDEVLTDLDVAGRLAGLPADRVTLVRIYPETPGTPWSSLAPRQGIEIVDVAITPERPAPLSPAVVTVQAINFAEREATRSIVVRLGGNLSAADTLVMPGRSVMEREYPVLTPGRFLFDVSVNPTRQVGASAEMLLVTAVDRARPGVPFSVVVRDPEGVALPDAEVLVDGELVAQTGSDGRTRVTVDDPSLVTISARHGDRAGGTEVAVAPEAWDGTNHLVAERVFIGAPSYDRSGAPHVPVHVSLVNLGTVSRDTTVVWTVDGANKAEEEVRIAPGRRATYTATVAAAVGSHELVVLDRSMSFNVPAPTETGSAASPQTVDEAVEAYREKQASLRGTGRDAAGAFLDRTFQGIGSATSIVVIATVVHAGSLVWVTIVREARERERVQSTLRLLGAERYRIEGRVLRDTFVAVLPSVVVGSLLAWGLLALGRALGWPRAFGHTLPTAGSLDILLRAGATVLVVALLAAFYVAQQRERPVPSAPVRQPTAERLEAWR